MSHLYCLATTSPTLLLSVLLLWQAPVWGQPAEAYPRFSEGNRSAFTPFTLEIIATGARGNILPATAVLSYGNALIAFDSHKNRLYTDILVPDPVQIIIACYGYDTLVVQLDPAKDTVSSYHGLILVHPDRPLWISALNRYKDVSVGVRLKKPDEGWTFLQSGLYPCRLGEFLVSNGRGDPVEKQALQIDDLLDPLSMQRVAAVCGGWYVRYSGPEMLSTEVSDSLLIELRGALMPLNMVASMIVYVNPRYRSGWLKQGYREPPGEAWLSNRTTALLLWNDIISLRTTANKERLQEIIEVCGLDWSKRGDRLSGAKLYWSFQFAPEQQTRMHDVANRLLSYPEITEVFFSRAGSGWCGHP